jgi:GT2 family glycosyltransferase
MSNQRQELSLQQRVRTNTMRVYVILLNWNGWRDTIECLESLSQLNYPDLRVVVCDNHSHDGSLDQIKAWATGQLQAQSLNPQLTSLTTPPCPKPISLVHVTKEQAETNAASYEAGLVLIQTGANLGFAGGNNVGVRYALGDPECAFVWLLNNDTVAEPNALSAMVDSMQSDSTIGICGSLNLSYYNPEVVQARGGKRYNLWTGRVQALPSLTVDDSGPLAARMDFINGASTLASRDFLEKVGLMDESYFLYFEELDWAMRAKGKFSLGYASRSIIYHKEGAQLGSNPDRTKRSLISEQYLSRNRVLFTRRFAPWALPTVLTTVVLAAAYRCLKGDPVRARAMLSCALLGLRNRDIPLESKCSPE